MSQAVLVPITKGILGNPQAFPADVGGLVSISCVNGNTCYVVGRNASGPIVVPITNGTPGPAQAVPGVDHLSEIACANPNTC